MFVTICTASCELLHDRICVCLCGNKWNISSKRMVNLGVLFEWHCVNVLEITSYIVCGLHYTESLVEDGLSVCCMKCSPCIVCTTDLNVLSIVWAVLKSEWRTCVWSVNVGGSGELFVGVGHCCGGLLSVEEHQGAELCTHCLYTLYTRGIRQGPCLHRRLWLYCLLAGHTSWQLVYLMQRGGCWRV